MISKKITTCKEELDINLQLVATELDTSVNTMKYIAASMMEDAFSVDAFNAFIEEVKKSPDIISFNDNTTLFEWEGEAVVIHTMLANTYLLFDSAIASTIEIGINKYK